MNLSPVFFVFIYGLKVIVQAGDLPLYHITLQYA